MSAICATDVCPVILNATCVYYQGDTLVYTGIVAGENLETALQKINAKFEDAGLGYVFTNGLIQSNPGEPVRLGGSLTQDTVIGGNYTLSFNGFLGASKFIKSGGLASQFLKADGSVDSTSYQPAGNYITALTGDVIANGPGATAASLALVNTNPGTYGSATKVPILTVDNKGRVTNVTLTTITVPSSSIILTGDVYGSGVIGTSIPMTLAAVNSNVYGGNTFLKFGVDAKGRVTSAAPISALDISGVLGYTPVPDSRTITINGVAQNLSSNRSWNVGTVSSVSATNGAGIAVSVTNPNTTPQINIVNTAPDRIVSLLAGAGIQVVGTYPNFTINALNPIATAGGELSGTYPNPILVNSAVISKVLTGLNITGGNVLSTDDILTAFGKLQNQINGLIGGSIYQGTWDASTNTPTLTSGVGIKGHYYIVSVEGTTVLDGVDHWHVGDWAIFDGAEWQKVDNTDAVVSVNGYTGAVNITTQDVPEAVNLYFTTDRARNAVSAGVGLSYDNVTGVFTNTITQYTDALARQAISITNIGNNGSASYDNGTGVLNIPNYTLAGLGGVPTSTTITINGLTQDLSENRSWSIAAGVTSFNTRTGAITLTSTDVTDALGFTPYNATNPSGYITGINSTMVTTALGFTPVTNARTLTINGVAYDLTADRSWTIASGVTSFNTRTGAITLTSGDVTGALGYTPYNSTNPSGYITSSGTAAAINQTVGGGSEANLVYSQIADNDFFRIRVGGSSNAGWVEIATADDGTEPIYVRQYTGVFSSVTRTATLLDGSGNTSFPGTVTAPTFSGNLSGNASSASSVAWGNVTSKPSLVMYYQGFTLNADTMDGNSTGFTYSVNAPYTGPIARFSETGYSLQLNAAYGGGGTQFAFRTRQGDGGYFNAWRRILNDGADPYAANMNQYVRTSDSPSFAAVSGNDVYTTGGWFRNHTNNSGIYWSNTGWHLYPKNSSDFYLHSGTSDASIHFQRNGTNANYIHNASDNAIGFLSTGRSWILRVDNSGNTTASGDVTAYSDIRLKENIVPLTNALEKVLKLQGVFYNRIDIEDKSTKIGFIAQHVKEVVPEVVHINEDALSNLKDRHSIDYGKLTALLTEAVKEQQVKIEAQDKVIEELKSIINGFTK